MENAPDVVVVGAGAAGILAAWRAASIGARVTLLEKNDRIGIKILISGGGKCNITHDGSVEEVLRGFRSAESRFLRPSFYRFTNQDILAMLTKRGLEVYTRPDGRVFPSHGTAKDVVAILEACLREAGVRLQRKTPVRELIAEGGAVRGVRTDSGQIRTSCTILAVGGSSYPGTGATGDGWPWARELGHTVVTVRPALAPLFLNPARVEWAGVALRDVLLKARQAEREIARRRGDLLFTHRGVSGPAALEISRTIAESLEDGPVALQVDLRPDASFEELKAQMLEAAEQNSRQSASSFVERFIPGRLASGLLECASIPAERSLGRMERRERNRLIEAVKGWWIGAVQSVPLEKGEVVAGGVSLDEVDPHSMKSRIVEGLYLCGEMLDVAGSVGGYNLQAAFSTGWVAGESAARDALARGERL